MGMAKVKELGGKVVVVQLIGLGVTEVRTVEMVVVVVVVLVDRVQMEFMQQMQVIVLVAAVAQAAVDMQEEAEMEDWLRLLELTVIILEGVVVDLILVR